MTPSAELPPTLTPQVTPPERDTPVRRASWKWILAVAIVAAAIFVIRRGKGAATEAGQGSGALPILAVAKIEREDLSQAVTISGEFRPFQQVALHAKVAGFLQSIGVDVGDHVREGQEIARLDVPELKNELEKASAALRTSGEEVARAESSYAEAHLTFSRLKEVARQRPNLVAQQELDTLQAKDATSSGAVSVAKSKVEECQAEVGRIQSLVAYTTITAPFAGVVTRRSFDPGALIQAGTAASAPLVEIAEDKKLRFVFPVPESVVPLVRVGAPVRITVTSMGQTIDAQVSRVAGKIDRSTRTMSTEADIDNLNGRITPGMYASVSLVVRECKGAIAVPVQALAVGQHPTVLIVAHGDTVEERAVTLGLETPEKAEVLDGLQPGDVVLVGTRSGIRPGQKVVTKLITTASVN